MDFWKVIEERKSVRIYQKGKIIPPEDLEKLVNAGKRAPSAGAIYPVEFIVIEDKETIDKLCKACRNQKQVGSASALIIVTADPQKSAQRYGEPGRNLYAIQDAAAAIENILLGATALGLGACWIGGFEEDEVRSVLNFSKEHALQAVITLGWEENIIKINNKWEGFI